MDQQQPRPMQSESDSQLSKPSRTMSCQLCSRAKVKCTRTRPACAYCVRHKTECRYLPPQPPKRKKRKLTEDELYQRLRQYQEILQAYGIQVDDELGDGVSVKDDQEGTPRAQSPPNDSSSSQIEEPLSWLNLLLPQNPGRFIEDGEKTRFIENGIWNSLSDELQGLRDLLRIPQMKNGVGAHAVPFVPAQDRFLSSNSHLQRFDGVDITGDLVLASRPRMSATELRACHPSPIIILKIWQIYLENINPLSKLVHAPTMQKSILEWSTGLDDITKDCEAFLMAMYFAVVQSISRKECHKLFKEERSILICRYQEATKSALLIADFMSSPTMMAIRAFHLYLLPLRHYVDVNTLWMLTGVAVRLGQRAGLHRDGTKLGLSPFETEMRRRLWWPLIALDTQVAELSGAGGSSCPPLSDCQRSLNVNDSDLSPDMSAFPREHEGATEMIFIKFRAELGMFLREAKTKQEWFGLNSNLNPAMVARKITSIKSLEAKCEEKFFKYCDPKVPLHMYTLLIGKIIFQLFRFIAIRPSRSENGRAGMTQMECDEIFHTCLKVIDCHNQLRREESMERYRWHVNAHSQWHSFVLLANELFFRTTGEDAERGWALIEGVFEYNPYVIFDKKISSHRAISRLTLKAWSARECQLRKEKLEFETPRFIPFLRDVAAATDVETGETSEAAEAKSTAITTTAPYSSTTTHLVAPPIEPSSGPVFMKPPDVQGHVEPLAEPSFGQIPQQDDFPLANSLPPSVDWIEWDTLLQDFQSQAQSILLE